MRPTLCSKRWLNRWRQHAFLAGYHAAIGDYPSFPRNEALFKQLIEIFVLEKTLYEICYGAANRSGHIPQARVVKIIGHGKHGK